ncbi:transposase [Alicyclobacillus suci]|uniref:transposase n=1 Tax=Alicyclobacillus suci TaxID=2816080 RepID=UPI001A8EA875|nr:transposase [Alicyclobacillus suci]
MPGRKWTVDVKMNIVLEGMMPGANISEVCRRHGVAQSLYCKWREAFLAGGRAGLQSESSTREQELEKELLEARAKIGELTMQVDVSRKNRIGAGSK